MTAIEIRREDWPAVIREIGLPVAEIARLLNAPDSTVRSWASGSTPLHHYGDGLLRLLAEKKSAEIAKHRDIPVDMWGKKRP